MYARITSQMHISVRMHDSQNIWHKKKRKEINFTILNNSFLRHHIWLSKWGIISRSIVVSLYHSLLSPLCVRLCDFVCAQDIHKTKTTSVCSIINDTKENNSLRDLSFPSMHQVSHTNTNSLSWFILFSQPPRGYPSWEPANPGIFVGSLLVWSLYLCAWKLYLSYIIPQITATLFLLLVHIILTS